MLGMPSLMTTISAKVGLPHTEDALNGTPCWATLLMLVGLASAVI